MERSDILHYAKINGQIELIGEGVNALTISNTIDEKQKRYIHDKAPRTTVSGYKVEVSVDAELIKSDKFLEHCKKIGYEQITGEDAQTEIIHVFTAEKESDNETTFKAIKQPMTILVENPGSGDADNGLGMSIKLKANGALEKGKFDTASKQFTKG